jgi:hypothetical protein
MYEVDTILKLKEPRNADPETGEDFAYNRVRVIGPSPVSHADKGEWTGADAAGVLLEGLTNFGATLDYPFGFLRTVYDVESIPEREVPAVAPVRVVNATTAAAGPTPEEVFAEKAPGTPSDGEHPRARTKPLGEPGGPEKAVGPLGRSRTRRAKPEEDAE